MTAEMIIDRLKQSFPDATVEASDMTGGGDHWAVKIKSKAFANKPLVEQHQMVYKALGEWMKKEIHALKIETLK
ncbi:MAG: BolA family transcriptional regulator [Deltaproteobacteria bacterium]|nr:BolA family transcriptional regulator [Deltaproteobacteria bacterium]